MEMITQLDTSAPVFSCDIPDLVFSTESDAVAVSLSQSGCDPSLDTTVYTFGSSATLYDIRETVEACLLSADMSFATFALALRGDKGDELEVTLKVVYCSQKMLYPAAGFCSAHFLSTLQCKRLSRFAAERLYFFSMEENPSATVSATVSLGGVARQLQAPLAGIVQDEPGVWHVKTSYASVAALLREKLPSQDFDEILHWQISVGERSFRFFPTDIVPDWQFAFRNCFNAWEYASLSCVTTEKTSVSKTEAHLGYSSTFYDFSVEKSYEVRTSPLMVDEARWLEQLAQARQVLLVVPSSDDFASYPKLLVSEGDISFSDSDEDTASVTFVWKFADDRPCITYSTTYFKIFTEHFDKAYR